MQECGRKTNRTCYFGPESLEMTAYKRSISTSFPFCCCFVLTTVLILVVHIIDGLRGEDKRGMCPSLLARCEDLIFLILFACKSLCHLPCNKWRPLFTFIHQLKCSAAHLPIPPPPKKKKKKKKNWSTILYVVCIMHCRLHCVLEREL